MMTDLNKQTKSHRFIQDKLNQNLTYQKNKNTFKIFQITHCTK